MKIAAPFLLALALIAADDIPQTPKRPVTDDYNGTKIVDDYRWLENSADPEVRAWSDAQNARTRAYLDHLPDRAGIVDRLKHLYADQAPSFSGLCERGGTIFAVETKPPNPQPMIVTLGSLDDPKTARPIVDPNALDPSGAISIDWYVPSHDGKLVAVSLSKGGSEDGSLALFDTATGKQLPDSIARVNNATAAGSVAWNGDSSGFWYTRYPRKGERADADLNFYQQVWFHRVGAPESSDQYSLGKELPRIAEISLASTDDGKFVLARVANGDGGENLHYLLPSGGRWRQITRISDQTSQADFDLAGNLYLLTNKDAPMGKLLELTPPLYSLATAKTVITPGRSSIDGFLAIGSRLYVRYMAGGPSRLLDKPATGAERTINLAPVSSVNEMAKIHNQLLFESESYIDPPAWYQYDASNGATVKTALAMSSAADFSDAEVVRVSANSKDGTHIPMNIVRRKGTKLDGPRAAHRLRRLRDFRNAEFLRAPAHLARSRRRVGGYESARRLRIWRDVARTRPVREKTKRFRRFHRLRGIFDQIQVHESRQARDRRLEQRRTADGRGADPAPRSFSRGGEPRRNLRHAARGKFPQRRIQRHRIRNGEGEGSIQRAVRVFAVSSRERWHGLFRRDVSDGRERRARGSDELAQNDGAIAGGDAFHAPDLSAHQFKRRPRIRNSAGRADRRGRRRVRVFIRPVGNEVRWEESCHEDC
jgi:Prolyl oligopeptidase, N-terminal beta-propeller domain